MNSIVISSPIRTYTTSYPVTTSVTYSSPIRTTTTVLSPTRVINVASPIVHTIHSPTRVIHAPTVVTHSSPVYVSPIRTRTYHPATTVTTTTFNPVKEETQTQEAE